MYNRYRVRIVKILFAIFILFIVFVGIKFSQKPKTIPIPSSEKPVKSLISSGGIPNIPFKLASEFTIHIYAEGLGNPRDLVFSPGGTLLASNPIGNQIVALPDKDHNGVSDIEKIVIDEGNHVHGLAFYNKLFVAEEKRVVRYTWDEENLKATFDKVLFSLPENNNHNNRTLVFDTDGTLYISVGSTCNACLETSEFSATVLISDYNGTTPRVFAKGLRNAPFLAFNPLTNELWATEMGRDWLGDNTPPDEINIVRGKRDYGWPYCYGNRVHDNNFDPSNFHFCNKTELPVHEIPAHSAPLGLVFVQSKQFPSDWQHDLLVSYHGSWNRSIPTGYKVVRMKVKDNTITKVEDFLTGFMEGETVYARPVDLIFDDAGSLYVSDDKAGNIYIIQKKIKLSMLDISSRP